MLGIMARPRAKNDSTHARKKQLGANDKIGHLMSQQAIVSATKEGENEHYALHANAH